MKNWVIYRIRNRVNGKVYIGQTRQGLRQRKAEHLARLALGERDHKLYQAMRKYGIDAFEFEVVEHCLRPEYLDEAEKRVIADHNSFERGYNMTCGGDSVSDETRKKLSAVLTGRVITWRDKMTKTRKENRALGLHKDMRDCVAKGSANVNAKRYLIRYPDGKETVVFGLNQFCKEHGLTKKCLFDVLAGKQTHHKGFSLLARFNDHPEREYGQVAGNGAQPAALAG